VTPETLAPAWRRRATDLGLDDDAIERLLDGGVRWVERLEEIVAELLSPRGLTAQASTFDRRHVMRAFAARAREGAALDEIESFADSFLRRPEVVTLTAGAGEHVQRSDVIRRADGRTVSAIADAPRYSTVELLAMERRVLDGVGARRGSGPVSQMARQLSGLYRRGRRWAPIRRPWCGASAATVTGCSSPWGLPEPPRLSRSTPRARLGKHLGSASAARRSRARQPAACGTPLGSRARASRHC